MQTYPTVYLAVAALLVVVAAAQGGTKQESPSFCKGLGCPKYTVLKKIGGNIELRRYDPATYVSTKAPTGTDTDASDSFQRLFSYISGNNKAQQQIQMTVPVINKVEGSNFTVSFFVDSKGKASPPPAPKDKSVFTATAPAIDVYVLSYGGYSNVSIAAAKRDQLVKALKAASEPFDSRTWYYGGYDAPTTKTDRHNEVWIPKAGSFAASPGEKAAAPAAKAPPAAKPVPAGRRRV